jgi:hypothetical protein
MEASSIDENPSYPMPETPFRSGERSACDVVCRKVVRRLAGHATLACVAVFGVAGCRPGFDAGRLVHAPWRVVDVAVDAPPAPGLSSGENEAIDASAGAWFRFYRDGTATFVLESRFHAGRWTIDEAKDVVTVEMSAGNSRAFHLRGGWDGLLRVVELTEGRSATLVAETDDFDYGDRDIYSEAMNLWRVPLQGEVTDEMLRARLQSMLRYLAAYFEAAALKDLETVNVSALSTPFIFASNGLGLRQESALPVEWVVLFPEREDCRRMSRLIAGLFRDVSPPATKNRFMQYASMFRQMDLQLGAPSHAPVQTAPGP